MSTGESAQSVRTIVQVFERLRSKRVRLWTENGRLRYRAPKGALSREEIASLAQLSSDIVALLDSQPRSQVVVPPLEPRDSEQPVPLTYSQFKYWQAYGLGERSTVRSVASAIELHGALDVERLRHCALQVVQRHESLRTRVVVVDGRPLQHIQHACDVELPLTDLTEHPSQPRGAEVESLIHRLILQPVRVDTGPLFGWRLVRTRVDEHVLVLAMEHIISDGYSLNVVLRDLLASYVQDCTGGGSLLPPVAIQQADYAVWQRGSHESWLALHGPYWHRRLAGCRRLVFPGDADAGTDSAGYATVSVRVGLDMKEALQEWCRARRTTLVMAIFTAFVALVLRWCESSDAVIRYQTDGRSSPLIESAVGYFAAVLNLRIELEEQDSLLDLLQRVTREYCAACEHADFSYIDAQVPRPGYTRNSGFNWVPCAAVAPPATGDAHGLTWRPWPFERPRLQGYEWEDEPSVILFEQADGVEGTIFFSPQELAPGSMERFRDGLLLMLDQLLRQPQQLVTAIRVR